MANPNLTLWVANSLQRQLKDLERRRKDQVTTLHDWRRTRRGWSDRGFSRPFMMAYDMTWRDV